MVYPVAGTVGWFLGLEESLKRSATRLDVVSQRCTAALHQVQQEIVPPSFAAQIMKAAEARGMGNCTSLKLSLEMSRIVLRNQGQPQRRDAELAILMRFIVAKLSLPKIRTSWFEAYFDHFLADKTDASAVLDELTHLLYPLDATLVVEGCDALRELMQRTLPDCVCGEDREQVLLIASEIQKQGELTAFLHATPEVTRSVERLFVEGNGRDTKQFAARQVLLALLKPIHQFPNEGNCYAVAPARHFQVVRPQLLVELLHEVLRTGSFTCEDEEVDLTIAIPSILKDRPIAHQWIIGLFQFVNAVREIEKEVAISGRDEYGEIKEEGGYVKRILGWERLHLGEIKTTTLGAEDVLKCVKSSSKRSVLIRNTDHAFRLTPDQSMGEERLWKRIEKRIELLRDYPIPEKRLKLLEQIYDANLPTVVEIKGKTPAEIYRSAAVKHLSNDKLNELMGAVDRMLYQISSCSLKSVYPKLARRIGVCSEIGLRLKDQPEQIYRTAYGWAKRLQQDLIDTHQGYLSLGHLEKEIALALNRPPTLVLGNLNWGPERCLVQRYSFCRQRWDLYLGGDEWTPVEPNFYSDLTFFESENL